ncbi:hypothetical protein OAT84_01535 [Gammaproteobacteria bacterium]|nr:hypothetical protein [Gammaproteobacteria bacterium]
MTTKIHYQQSPYLLQTLSNVSILEVTLYEAICLFLERPSYHALQSAIQIIDLETAWSKDLSPSQAECIQYLIRDWGVEHLKSQLTIKQKKSIYMTQGKKQSAGHFLTAIDYAKRSPKDHHMIMQFGLTLLIHSALKPADTKPKIEALEQLLSSIYRNEQLDSGLYTKNISYLIAINLCLCLFILLNYYSP